MWEEAKVSPKQLQEMMQRECKAQIEEAKYLIFKYFALIVFAYLILFSSF